MVYVPDKLEEGVIVPELVLIVKPDGEAEYDPPVSPVWTTDTGEAVVQKGDPVYEIYGVTGVVVIATVVDAGFSTHPSAGVTV
jgi:hypothetical protein